MINDFRLRYLIIIDEITNFTVPSRPSEKGSGEDSLIRERVI